VRSHFLAAVAVAATALATVTAGCGFDDKLTSRGFVAAGDHLCDVAIGRAFLATQDASRGAGGLDAEGINTLATGFAAMAEGLRGLELREEDEAMRATMVGRYSQTANEIRAIAADAAAGDPGAPAAAVAAMDDLQPLAAELRAYGFGVCGGREPA
jgi:hypothetical protein